MLVLLCENWLRTLCQTKPPCSSRKYQNPPQDVNLDVVFIKQKVEGSLLRWVFVQLFAKEIKSNKKHDFQKLGK
jgi:hypothetical protein